MDSYSDNANGGDENGDEYRNHKEKALELVGKRKQEKKEIER